MTDIGEVSRPPGMMAAGVVQIAAGFGQAAARAMNGDDKLLRLANEVFQVPVVFPILPISGGAGSMFLDGPQAGDYWSIRRLQLTGFTAGSVILYRNAILTNINGNGTLIGTPEEIGPFPQAGMFTFGRGEVLLNPNDTMALVATGITVAAGFAGVFAQGAADRVPAYLLPEYLS